ncbi:MAG: SGNH/GDSL hydrolase family protein [Methylovirgula sp.]
MMPHHMKFWACAVGMPFCLGLCAYLIYVSHFASHTTVLYLLLLLLLLADITSLVPEWARRAFLVLTALMFGLCLVEAAALAFASKSPAWIRTSGFVVPDRVLGWGPGYPGVYHAKIIDMNTGRTIYVAASTLDDHRLRKTISSDHGPTVAFVGDSFTFGIGVNDAETMPQAFADLTDHKIRVLNLGFGAYSPQQFLRAMETGVFDKILGPDLRLFVLLTAPWHSERVACKVDYVAGAPRYVLENGNPVYAGVCFDHGRPWLEGVLSRVAILRALSRRYSFATNDDIRLYIAEIRTAAALARQRYHVPTVVLFMSAGNMWMSGFTDQEIMKELRAGGLPVIDTSLAQHTWNNAKLMIPGGWHPTPFAHRARAMLLKQFLDVNMPEILAPSRR